MRNFIATPFWMLMWVNAWILTFILNRTIVIGMELEEEDGNE